MSNPISIPLSEGGSHAASDRPPQIRAWHLQKRAFVYIRQSSMEQVRDNTGSTAVQRSLAELPRKWGWPESLIEVIDQDLGMSGTSASKRTGFQELLALIKDNQVGIVLVRDLGRLSRTPTDFMRFLEAARRAKLLIYHDGALYDLATETEMALFVKIILGLLPWLENATRVQQFMAARVAKAGQGHAVSRPPIGYVKSVHGHWNKDPDPEVQKTIRLVFELTGKLGSLGAVVQYMRKQNLSFPRRRRGTLTWEPPSRPRLHSVVTNPVFTGIYVYGRVRIIPAGDGTPRQIERRPESEWTSSENHHEPYVTTEEWRTINAALAARRPGVRPIVGKGAALLQGSLRCSQCHRWLWTQYSARDGRARGASYVCRPIDQWGKPLHSVSCPARLLDQAVVREVLSVLTPAEMDAALAVIDDACAEQGDLERTRARQLRQVEDDVAEADRLYQNASRSNPRAKAHYEQKLETALERREKLKLEVGRAIPPKPVTVTQDDAAELRALTANIQNLWNAASNEDRKRLFRAVISEIAVLSVTQESVELEICWIGGLRQRLPVLRPKGVDGLVEQLHKAGKDPAAFVDELRAADTLTAKGTPMSRPAVYQALGRLGMSRKDEKKQIQLLIRQLLLDRCPRTQMLKIVQREAPPALGKWTRQRLNQYVSKLYQGVPGIPALPTVLPTEQDKQAVLDLIRRRHDERATWSTIAVELNGSDLLPPRASAFTAAQVAKVFSRRQRQHRQGGSAETAAT